jgi:hypothetical protein
VNDTPRDATGVPLAVDAARAVSGGRARREAAYRERAWRIALLGSCICTWPIDVAPTASGHHIACPAELMLSSKR